VSDDDPLADDAKTMPSFVPQEPGGGDEEVQGESPGSTEEEDPITEASAVNSKGAAAPAPSAAEVR
jgi:hypothetical protein